ncbi:glycosyltransferase family 39 protein [uncultured Dialister sp.]|mgnify:CR=1 FL=1|uniref:ArnT family glycosyltransferase n=1 Tax=uncultured Dialister sp. TaxID=278064 RepID=UPI00262C586C|nr:glycosyltransferase family 39 protein [uncultured Dialister sp.]
MKRKNKLHETAAESSRKEVGKTLLFFFLAAFLFLLWGSWLLPVTDPVESNYALTAKEMVQSGNWMSPQIYGTYWYDKPIMVYWLLSISYTLLGFTDLASRLPSVICGALSVTLLIWYVQRILKDNVTAVWSGAMLALSLEFWVISHAIITDSILLLFTIPTMLSGYMGVMEGNKKHLAAAYAAAGLACLTKGPVGLVLPGALLLLWCLSMKSGKMAVRLFPWQGILVFLAVTLPWYVGMYLIHGSDFIEQFLGLHNFIRATSSEHPADNHWYYYLVLLPAALLPWTFTSFYEMVKGWKEKTPFYRFLMVWCWGTLLFYTLMATKYVTYTYIAVVPAIIFSALAAPAIRQGESHPFLAGLGGFVLFLAAAIAGSLYIKEGSWWILYVVILYALWSLGIRYKKSRGRRLTVMAAVTASVFLCLIMEGLPHYLPRRSAVELAEEMKAAPGEHYFFRSYPAGYTFYTGEIATRVVPPPIGDDGEGRNPLWNEKYVMPSAADKDFVISHRHPEKPVFLYVSKSDRKYFDQWFFKYRFKQVKPLLTGAIFIMTDAKDIPESFKEAKEQMKKDMKEDLNESPEND